jgi:hypothetical protein
MDFTNAGTYPNPTGSPIWPGSTFTGPLIVGNVMATDGTGTLAGAGEQSGTANAGIAVVAQSWRITQAASAGQSAGVFLTPIVIPAQSQILSIVTFVSVAFSGAATTFGLGTTASATALTAASAVVTSGALGKIILNPGTGATQIGNWINVGNTDVQILVTSTNTGAGVATLTVEYVPGINLSTT